MAVRIEGGYMAKYIRPTQLEKKSVIRHFAMKWSTSARVDFCLLERQTRACSYSSSSLLSTNTFFCW